LSIDSDVCVVVDYMLGCHLTILNLNSELNTAAAHTKLDT